jgi:S-methylmethionine-dependent homocysteine/selenocysteine methylase
LDKPNSGIETMKYRNNLPQLKGEIFLTDGGIETTLIFHDGFDLPLFAAFDLFKTEEGRAGLEKYFSTYAAIAKEKQLGLVLESATWRASADWGTALGYSSEDLKHINREAISALLDIRWRYETPKSKMVISGCIGPRGDGYNPSSLMTAEEAESYHAEQIKTFFDTEADLVTAITMTYPAEAIGIARAAKSLGMPVVISFTVETDGKLPSGHSLQEAIEIVDKETDSAPIYYMINCAHPTHFEGVLETGAAWVKRIAGIRANASCKSHAELNEATELDAGNPEELAQQYRELRERLSHINVLGGCCGTDHRHIAAISNAVS